MQQAHSSVPVVEGERKEEETPVASSGAGVPPLAPEKQAKPTESETPNNNKTQKGKKHFFEAWKLQRTAERKALKQKEKNPAKVSLPLFPT